MIKLISAIGDFFDRTPMMQVIMPIEMRWIFSDFFSELSEKLLDIFHIPDKILQKILKNIPNDNKYKKIIIFIPHKISRYVLLLQFAIMFNIPVIFNCFIKHRE